MKSASRMPELPDISDVFRATASGAGEQPPLTFCVALSRDHAPFEMCRVCAAPLVHTAPPPPGDATGRPRSRNDGVGRSRQLQRNAFDGGCPRRKPPESSRILFSITGPLIPYSSCLIRSSGEGIGPCS